MEGPCQGLKGTDYVVEETWSLGSGQQEEALKSMKIYIVWPHFLNLRVL